MLIESKMIDPQMCAGPAARFRMAPGSDSEVSVRVPNRVLVGATVHLRARERTAVGGVRHCAPIEAEFEIRVLVREIR
jgi:hypothetical protein